MDVSAVKIEVYVPQSHLAAVREALAAAGAGRVGNYDNVCSYYPVTGSWRPLPGATPYEGSVGEVSAESEVKLEMRCAAEFAAKAVEAARQAHPYEEPLINVIPLWNAMV